MGNQLCKKPLTNQPAFNESTVGKDDIYNPHKKYQTTDGVFHGNFLKDHLIIQNSTKSHEKIINQLRLWDKQLDDETKTKVFHETDLATK